MHPHARETGRPSAVRAPAAASAATAAPPVTPEEFGRLATAAGLSPAASSTLAVAVSGGADSMALAHLVAAWSKGRRGTVAALTVDHRLRPNSATEAEAVARRTRRIGYAPCILVWQHGNLTRRIQETARAERYRLLASWCRSNGVAKLLLAHHLDDQAETFLMRLAAGSGIRGLGCMRTRVPLETIELVRPLLEIPKSRLLATVRHYGGGFVDDPSNRDTRYTRSRIRQLLQDTGAQLPGAGQLARAARDFARLDDLAHRTTLNHLRFSLAVSPLGFVTIDRNRLTSLPDRFALRCLGAVVQGVAGGPYPPRTRSLLRLLEEIRRGPSRAGTLGGAILASGREQVTVTREPRAVAGPIRLQQPSTRWDNRFRIETPVPRETLTVGALGPHLPDPLPSGIVHAGVRRTHFATLPALRDLDGLVAVPHLDWWRDERLRSVIRVVFEPRSHLLADVLSSSENQAAPHRYPGRRGHT